MGEQSNTATGYPPPRPPHGYPTPPGATAYAYQGHPPPPYPNYYPPPYYNNNNNNNNNPFYAGHPSYNPQSVIFFRRLFTLLVVIFIVMGIVFFITWLVLRPRFPDFRVETLRVSGFNANSSSNEISASWDVQFTVSNPNQKLHVYYDEVSCYVFYKNKKLAENELPPFDQGTKSESNVTAKLATASTYVNGGLMGKINWERSRGRVGFDVSILAIAQFKSGAWRARRRWIRVYCDDLGVGISSNGLNGTLIGGPKECRVG